MKKFISALLCVLLILTAFTACSDNDAELTNDKESNSSTSSNTASNSSADITSSTLTGLHHVEMVIKDYGTIKIELNADKAPISVENFMTLAEEGFYDGIGFHRYAENSVLQGGDPDGDGYGGSDKTIKGEFEINGVANDLKHTRGAISMARTSVYDSATSQFFICLDTAYCSSLDGQYAAFGYITEGMDIIDKICAETPVSNSIPKDEQPIIETVKVID